MTPGPTSPSSQEIAETECRFPTLLIVDDDPRVTDQLASDLSAHGFRVITANDADSASQLALRTRPDVLLLDVEMPRYTGLELHQALQFSERGRAIPVVFFLPDARPENQQVALAQGARAVLPKSCDLLQLVATHRQIVQDARRAPFSETAHVGPRTGNGKPLERQEPMSLRTTVVDQPPTTVPVAAPPVPGRGSPR